MLYLPLLNEPICSDIRKLNNLRMMEKGDEKRNKIKKERRYIKILMFIVEALLMLIVEHKLNDFHWDEAFFLRIL